MSDKNEMDATGMERWRGAVDARLTDLKDDVNTLFAKIKDGDERERLLALKVEGIATKIGLYASIGAFLGGGIMSLLVGFFFKK